MSESTPTTDQTRRAKNPTWRELAPTACRAAVGVRPWWMSPYQFEPCRCVLPVGHRDGHECEHTMAAGRAEANR